MRLLDRLRTGQIGHIAHGVMTSGVAVGLASVLNYLVIIILTRVASRAEVGTFSYVISTATILATLADFGMTNALTRAYHSVDKDERERVLAMSLVTRGALSAVVGLACLVSGNPDLRWVGILLFLWPGDTLILFLNAKLAFNRAALLRIAAATLYLGGAIALFVATESPGLAALARGASLALIGGVIAYRTLDRRAFSGWTWARLRRHLRLGVDYFALTASSAIFGHVDVLLLSWLMTRDDVGLYRPLFTLAIVPSMLAMVVRVPLNAIVSSGQWTDRRKLLRVVHTLVGVLAAISGLVVLVGVTWAEEIVGLVLGPAYIEGADIFRIVLVTSAMVSLISPYHSFILMRGRVRPLVVLAIATAVGLVVLDLILIPRLGPAGAAWARLGVQLIGLAGVLWLFYGGFLRELGGGRP